MAKRNTRAIAKLQEAQKVMRKLGRSQDTTAGMAFAQDLINLLERGKHMEMTFGADNITFKPDDVRVSRTRVMISNRMITMCKLVSGNDADDKMTYQLGAFDDENMPVQPLVISIREKEMA